MRLVSFWIVFLAACLISALLVGARLLVIAANAIVHGRLTREAALNIANVGGFLRLLYRDTVRESLPQDIREMLVKLPKTPKTKLVRLGRN